MSLTTGDRANDERDREAQQGGPPSEDWAALKDDVGQMAGVAVEGGRHFLESAKEQAAGYTDRRKNDAARMVVDLAGSLRESCRAFEDRPNIRAFVEGAAEGLEQLADTIRARSVTDMVGEVEAMVRRRPATVAAASMLAGVIVARFIKSSAAAALREAEHDAPRRSPAARRPAQRGHRRAGSRASSQAGT